VNWNSCSAQISNTGAEGNTVPLVDGIGPDVGSATYSCTAAGTWSLVGGSNSCSMLPPVDPTSDPCPLPWGGTIEHGQSVTAYGTYSAFWGPEHFSDHFAVSNRNHRGFTPCESSLLVNRYQKCTSAPPTATQILACWVSTERTDPFGPRAEFAAMRCRGIFRGPEAWCPSEVRICNDGNLSGSFTNQTCGSPPVPDPGNENPYDGGFDDSGPGTRLAE